ncbi:hypothetical protein [Amycolatopsis thermophila]|uniref:Uncharacterized protein n=1 Tax=Amycolatopsis thermophila TaxID=206084 RepID=A0ABU0EL93_9PSEU|nr:hypothetical protein [Amycolatopsis thermophila]MDQ0376051.1 hypothetical protein [Amycolatopsis thermophila]
MARTRLSPPRPRAQPQTGPARALRVVATLAANATLLTGLLYYFGFLTTQVFFSYFRVHYTLLGQTTPEILARGVDGLLLPVAEIAAAVFLLLGLIRFLHFRLSRRAWQALLRRATPVAAVLGAALLAVTIAIALDPVPYRRFTALPGLGFALAVVLLIFAWRRWTSPAGSALGVAEWLVAYALVTFGLFWAAADYAGQVGVRRAFETEQALAARPAAVLFSTQELNLPGEVHCPAADGSFQYRYPGLKLLLQSGGQYVLVPDGWQRTGAPTYLLPRTNTVWLEFGPPGTPAAGC